MLQPFPEKQCPEAELTPTTKLSTTGKLAEAEETIKVPMEAEETATTNLPIEAEIARAKNHIKLQGPITKSSPARTVVKSAVITLTTTAKASNSVLASATV